MSKEKMLAAKELILSKNYAEAREILEKIDHPTARKWLEKLDNIAPVVSQATIVVDWALLNREAYEFSKIYGYEHIEGLDKTTIKDVQNIISSWIASGKPLTALIKNLRTIIKDPVIAELVAQTESTRVHFEGARVRWLSTGVTKAKWNTVNDPEVCPICKSLNNKIGSLEKGWLLNGTYYTPPAHPGCRCFARPVVN